jgi:hypothetical protein
LEAIKKASWTKRITVTFGAQIQALWKTYLLYWTEFWQ